MPKSDILPVFRKIGEQATKKNCDISFDQEDRQWFITINFDSCGPHEGSWAFTSHGKACGRIGSNPFGERDLDEGDLTGAATAVSVIYFEYYPPNAGRLRFDGCIEKGIKRDPQSSQFLEYLSNPEVDECLSIYNGLLRKFGNTQNTVEFFEDLSQYKIEERKEDIPPPAIKSRYDLIKKPVSKPKKRIWDLFKLWPFLLR